MKDQFFIVVRMPNGSLHTVVNAEGGLATFSNREEVGNAIETTTLCQVGIPLIFNANEHIES